MLVHACFGTCYLVMVLFLSTFHEISRRREESPKPIFTIKRKKKKHSWCMCAKLVRLWHFGKPLDKIRELCLYHQGPHPPGKVTVSGWGSGFGIFVAYCEATAQGTFHLTLTEAKDAKRRGEGNYPYFTDDTMR